MSEDKYSESIYLPEYSELKYCIWNALNGKQTKFADKKGLAIVYKEQYGRFAELQENSYQAYNDLAQLVRPGRVVLVRGTGPNIEYPEWKQLTKSPGYLMVLDTPVSYENFNFTKLTRTDIPEMQKLSELTGLDFTPGKFELGDFYGVKENDVLVAMAGERLKPDGYIELATVSTHPDYRRRGYGRGLSSVLSRRIQEKGYTPFLHVKDENSAAIRLYEQMGYKKCLRGYYDVLERTSYLNSDKRSSF